MKYLLLSLLISLNVQAKNIRIAVIDSGLSEKAGVNLCEHGLVDVTGTGLKAEYASHGNNITHIITDNLNGKDYCLVSIKAFSEKRSGSDYVALAIYVAVSRKVDIINISGGGTHYDKDESKAIKLAIDNGIIVVTAAGNNYQDLDKKCNFFPACYFGVITVANKNTPSSNYGNKVIDLWRNGNNVKAGGTTLSGTSQAAAIASHELALKLIGQK